MKKILLANPRGFCSGVFRAIQMVEKALETFGAPIYVKHKIVHNRHVIHGLQEKGAIFIEDLQDVPEGSSIVYSAHGVSPSVRFEAKKRNLVEIDATCGLVKKIHEAVKLYDKQGYKILLIGHENHIEIQGIRDEVSHPVFIISSVEDISTIPFSSSDKIFYATQTTFNVEKEREIVKELEKIFPFLETLEKSSICFATLLRQKALQVIAKQSDLILIIGDPSSSNSRRLLEVALSFQSHSYLINGPDEMDKDWVDRASCIGISAGASTPEWVLEKCVNTLKKWGVEEVEEFFYQA
ncbi:MAG: 4-hydroxy-3-methylbut-2-enyl diphosphate reductase [Chlamydiota bacterium]